MIKLVAGAGNSECPGAGAAGGSWFRAPAGPGIPTGISRPGAVGSATRPMGIEARRVLASVTPYRGCSHGRCRPAALSTPVWSKTDTSCPS